MNNVHNSEWKNFDFFENFKNIFSSGIKYSIKTYKKNQLLFRQGEICDALYILMSGSVKTDMIIENGNLLGVEIINAPRPLAPAFIFSSNNRFPVEVTAIADVEVLRIPKDEVIRIMNEQPEFMQQFLNHSANRTQFLSNRLQLLSIKTIKGKFAHFLLEQASKEGSTISINRNQTELAEFFGVARPSLARSISEMINDGVISVNKKEYKITDIAKLRDLLV